ncbi:MAG: metallophosphoesterase family protein [Bdellovibrionales bacterium]|nr:metallophosphoesterase family protein [Bdellovibrionales bacterium]
MKVALISDIHGNSEALSPVLEQVKRLNISKIIVSGDLVGYYYNVDLVLEMLNAWDCYFVGGNHEVMLKKWIDGFEREKILTKYGSSLSLATKKLSKEQINWLVNLPHRLEVDLDGRKALICHGTPNNVDEYVYPDSSIEDWEKFQESGFDITIYGHTHYPIVRKVGNGLVVNPGSVGQTRDRKPGACWALWETQSHTIKLMRTTYDPKPVIEQCQKYDPELKYLREVLVRT